MSKRDLLFSAKGRIGRGDFWVAWTLLWIASAVPRLLGPVGYLLSLAFLYPQVCLMSKRLHDIGKSGWRQLIWFGLVVVGALGAGALEALEDGGAPTGVMEIVLTLIATAAVLAGLVLSLRAMLTKGDPLDNAYGPPPAKALGAPKPETI